MGEWTLCRIFFRGEKAVDVCDMVLDELAMKGYVEVRRDDTERGMKFHVVKRLRDSGLAVRHAAATWQLTIFGHSVCIEAMTNRPRDELLSSYMRISSFTFLGVPTIVILNFVSSW